MSSKFNRLISKMVLVFLLLILPAPALAAGIQGEIIAEGQASENTPAQDASPEAEKTEKVPSSYLEGILLWSDSPHQAVSNRLEALSRRMDAFLGEDRIYEEATETYLQLRTDLIYERGGHVSFDHRLRLKLDLPQTEKRLKLLLESESDRDTVLDEDSEAPSIRDDLNPQQSNYSAALQFILKETRRWNISLGPGIRLRTPPDPFARLRIRRHQSMGSTWQNRLTERLTDYVDRGLESLTTLEFERRTSKGQLFRLTSGALWREEFEFSNIQLSQSAQVFQSISRRDTLVYEASVIWETKPHLHHETYIADVRWRRRIHKKWLFFEIKPQATFEREHHFRLDPSLTFSLEILFGERYQGPEDDQS